MEFQYEKISVTLTQSGASSDGAGYRPDYPPATHRKTAPKR